MEINVMETKVMYVKRDHEGKIVAVSVQAGDGFNEQVGSADPELSAFMQRNTPAPKSEVPDSKTQLLQNSDAELARVLEDIIDLLTAKGIFQFTELPPAAQQKLLARKNMRQLIRRLDLLADDDEGMLP